MTFQFPEVFGRKNVTGKMNEPERFKAALFELSISTSMMRTEETEFQTVMRCLSIYSASLIGNVE
jgi:hypothetical protein